MKKLQYLEEEKQNSATGQSHLTVRIVLAIYIGPSETNFIALSKATGRSCNTPPAVRTITLEYPSASLSG